MNLYRTGLAIRSGYPPLYPVGYSQPTGCVHRTGRDSEITPTGVLKVQSDIPIPQTAVDEIQFLSPT